MFLRDTDMFDSVESGGEALEIDENTGMLAENGVCYRGLFDIDPRFNLKDSLTTGDYELTKGFATPQGTAKYASRSSHVHPSNFQSVSLSENDPPLTLSKLVLGTQSGFA